MLMLVQKYNDAVITKYIPATDTKAARIQVRDISGKRKYFAIDYEVSIKEQHQNAAKFALEYRGYNPVDYDIVSVWMPDNSMVHAFILK